MADDLNPVSPIISGGSVTSGNPIPVWVVSGGGSTSNGFPVTSSSSKVSSGGIIEVLSGGIIQVDNGGSATVLTGAVLGISGALAVSAGGAIQLSSGATQYVYGNAAILVSSGASIVASNGALFGAVAGGSMGITSGGFFTTYSGGNLVVSAGTVIGAATANTLNSALANAPNVMPYQTGNFYGSLIGNPSSVNQTLVSGKMMAFPFYVARPTSFTSSIIFAVSMTSTMSCNFGIYSANADGTASGTIPSGATLVAGTGSSGVSITSNTSGVMGASVQGAGTFQVGWYWLALLTNSTMSAFSYAATGESFPDNFQRLGQSNFGSAAAVPLAYAHSQTFGSLPATFPTSTLTVSTAPAACVAMALLR